jgi:hypothetical protein
LMWQANNKQLEMPQTQHAGYKRVTDDILLFWKIA